MIHAESLIHQSINNSTLLKQIDLKTNKLVEDVKDISWAIVVCQALSWAL